MKKAAALLSIISLFISQAVFLAPGAAQASVSSWDKGATLIPNSTTDFGSSNTQQSLNNLKATGANFVAFVIPYYQSNINSTDIQAGWNTPTDQSLEAAVDYAHSIGLQVAFKIHLDPYSGEWRAYINPGDRDGWFTAYNNLLQHYGQIAQAHGVELFVIGTEFVSMATDAVNSTNTAHWQTLIANLRKIYSGKLTYDANSTNNNNDPFENEKAFINFWSSLDYVGLSAYYDLNTSSNDVQSLENQWNFWNTNDLAAFEQKVGKPLLFTEIGYRSVDGAHTQPWNWQMGGGYNAQEQANSYDALMSYWNNYPYMAGVFWWNWQTDPNAGGSGETGYTPQNKPAQQIMQKWFGNPTPPATGGSGSTPSIVSNATANPGGPQANTTTAITATVKNSGGTLSQGIVDIEVYNQSGSRVFQQFFDGQTINTNETRNYTAQWTPQNTGTYTVAVGVFNGDWSQNYSWNANALSITVGGSSSNPPPSGGGTGTTTPPSGGTSTSTPPTNNPPPPSNPPPTGSVQTDVWWPTNGSTLSGLQPFKAMLENLDVSQYQMFWQVDNGQLNAMSDNSTDYPHKEADVDLSGWHWSPNNQYTINFVSKNASGAVIGQQSVLITVQ